MNEEDDNRTPFEEYLDAIIESRRTYCDLCNKHAHQECEHPKNGYCKQFRLQAEKDQKEFNMKTKLTTTQLLCIISSAIIIAIGCEQGKMAKTEAVKLTHDTVKIDTIYYQPKKGDKVAETDYGIIKNGHEILQKVYLPIDTTTFITEHSEITSPQP